jgi:nicotinate-nucleotide pyrophosphorylase (carboxylating)
VKSDDSLYSLSVADFIALAFKEDSGDGDQTSLACIDSTATGKAIVKMKENGVIAGVELANQILNYADKNLLVKILKTDGIKVQTGDTVMEIEGNVRAILKAERLLLNCLQRMSGIATFTRSLVEKLKGTNAKILDTRKTTPNFRHFEKWAVRIGGGHNHRFGLYDMILIKNNHVDACGSITAAIQKSVAYLKSSNNKLPIEIETRNLDEVKQVLQCGGVNRIMLDNFSTDEMKKAVDLIGGSYETEASGGINGTNVRAYAETGVDYISVGALTHSYKSLDISLNIIL